MRAHTYYYSHGPSRPPVDYLISVTPYSLRFVVSFGVFVPPSIFHVS